MTQRRRDAIVKLLKGIETGDPASVAVVNEAQYIQHNPQTAEGNVGLAELFKRISKSNPRVNIVRIFSDGDFVFGHTEYDFSTRRIGFEVFRFEEDQAVEHWDNIQIRLGPNISGHSMVNGPVQPEDLEMTEENRATVTRFAEDVLIACDWSSLPLFIDSGNFTQHNPQMADGRKALLDRMTNGNSEGDKIVYKKMHRILAQGNFVLTVCEGWVGENHTSFYDLYRLENGKLVEHWDTVEAVPPKSQWKNHNGKF